MNKKLKIFNFQYFIFFAAILYSLIFHLFDFFSYLFKKKQVNVKSNIFKNYLEKNYTLWSKNNIIKQNKVLITNFVHHPGYTINESIIGKYVSEFYNLEPVVLINYNDEFGKKIIRSFGVNNIISQPKISLFQRLMYLIISFKIISKIKNIDQFICYSQGNINFGRCVYDHIVRNTSGGTIENINLKIYFFLAEALFYNKFYKSLFLNKKFEYMTMSETQFLPSNIVFQNALENNVKVISRIGGPEKLSARLYKTKDEKFQSNIKISKQQFNEIIKSSRDIFSKKGFENIKELYDGKKKHHDQSSIKNFIYKNDSLNSSKDLLKYFNWEKSKKICVIYSHNLYDGNYYNEWRIFRDNLTWLRKTLLYVKKNKHNINWIVKDHPSDYGINRNKNTTFKEFQKIIGNDKNIKFFPKKFKTKLLKDVTDCLFTSQGSAGIEFPCFGIPSIICGDAYYQGLGFTLEPKDEIEYYKIINNIDKVISNGLSNDQIKNAQAAYYFSEELIKVNHPLLFNYSILRNLDLNNFFSTLTDKVINYLPERDSFKISLKKQLENNNRHPIIEK